MTRTTFGALVAGGAVAAIAMACGGGAASPTATPTPTPTPAPTRTPPPEAQPIRIGALTSLSGLRSPYGTQARNGMRLAAERLNESGGLSGSEVVVVERDTKGSPDEAMTALRELAEREEIIAAGGVISSDVGLASARVAERLEVPLFLTYSASGKELSRESRFTFRTCIPPAPLHMAPVARLVEDRDLRRIGAIVADYAWGHAIERSIRELVDPLPGVDVQTQVAPASEKEFTTYLRRLLPDDLEMLILTGHPPGAAAAAKQAIELGMDALVLGPPLPPGTLMNQLGDAAFGTYVTYSCVDWEKPGYREVAEEYYKSFGRLMDDAAMSGYATVRLVADAVQRAGSREPPAIASAVRDGSFQQPGYPFPLTYTDWGELREAAMVLYTFRKGDPPGGINPGSGWHPEVLYRAPPVEPFPPPG